MSTLASLNIRIGADIKQFQKGLNQVNRDVRNATRGLRDVGSELTRTFSVPIAAIAGLSIKMAGDFEASMNRVKAISGATGDDFEKLRDVAKDLGRTTQFSATQAAEGLTFLSQAGFSATESTEALPGVLNLAAAGALELGQAADITSNVLSGFALEVRDLGRVNDVLANTFTSTNTNLQQLGEAFQYVGPVAASAGLSIEQTSAALGLLGNAGIQASSAGTALRGIISRLLAPTGSAAAILRKLGVNAVDSSGKLKDLSGIIDQLRKSGATTAELLEVFGDRAGPGMAALVSQGSDALDELTEKNKTLGTAARIAKEQMEGFNGQMKELRSAAEGLGIAIGEAGLLDKVTSLASGLTNVVQRLADTNPRLLNAATNVALVTAAVGPFLLITAKMITALGTVKKAYLAIEIAAKAAKLATGGWLGALGIGLGIVTPLLIGAHNAYKGINDEIKRGAGQLKTLRSYNGIGQGAYNYQIATGRDRSATDIRALGATLKEVANVMDPLGLGLKNTTQAIPPFIAAMSQVEDVTDDIIPPIGDATEEVTNLADGLDALVNAALRASRDADLSRLTTPKLGDITTPRDRISTSGLSVDPYEGLTASQENLLNIADKVNVSLKDQGSILEKLDIDANVMSESMVMAVQVFDQMSDSMARVADAGGTFSEVAAEIKKSAQSIIGSFIRQGVASIVSGTLTKSSFLGPLAIPAGLAAGALAQGAFNSILGGLKIPEFADGGLIYGPTLGLMGEYPGARNNPEVVGKLSDIRSLIGTPEVKVHVTGAISGRDIKLAMERNDGISSRLKGR